MRSATSARAVAGLRRNEPLLRKLRGGGTSWPSVQMAVLNQLSETLDDRWNRAHQLTPEVLTAIFGTRPNHKGGETFKQDSKTHLPATTPSEVRVE